MLVIREETRSVSGRQQGVCLLRHESFSPHIVYAVKRWCKVTVEGFQTEVIGTGDDSTVVGLPEGEEADVRGMASADTRQEDIIQVRADGFDVDDDNVPAPENIPNEEDTTQH